MMFLRLLIGIIPLAALAQTSAYQSTDSNSSIILDNAAGNVILNVADTKFTAGYPA